MKNRRTFGPNTILSKLLLPVIAVMLAQSLLYLALFWQGGVVSHANENAYDILDERVANRKQYIQNEMLHKWINFRDSEEKILNTISDSLTRRHATYEDIAASAKLNEELVAAVSDEIVYMLRRCMVTGVFIVLDGPGVQGNEQSRSGLYIRDLDPVGYVSDDSDLLMERGMPSIVKSRGIALDSYWAPVFTFKDPADPAEAFFYSPITAARENENKDSVNYGFWSGGFSLSGQDDRIITYSIPLINGDGVVFGVMGIDITEQYMFSLLQYQEMSTARNGAYMLAITEDHGRTYQRVIANGPLYQYAFGEAESIAVQNEITDSIFNFQSNNVPDAWGSVQKLKLYNPYTPFYDQEWVLVGLVRGTNLLSFSQTITMLSTIATIAFIVLGVVGVFFASRIVTQPITSLVNEVTRSDPNQLPKLKK